MKIVRSVATKCLRRAAVIAALGIAAAGGCSTGGQVDELVSSADADYSAPVWVGDTVYYLAGSPHDSDAPAYLMRVRAGGRPEQLTVTHPAGPRSSPAACAQQRP